MPRFRHLALLTENPERLAEFYQTVFEMKEVGRSPGAIYLSDGNINLALITKTNIPDHQRPTGIYHFGFEVENVDALRALCKELGAATDVQKRPANREAEYRVYDPDGNPVDLSQHGWPI